MTHKQRIYECLLNSGKPLSWNEIRKKTGLNSGAMSNGIKALYKKSLIVSSSQIGRKNLYSVNDDMNVRKKNDVRNENMQLLHRTFVTRKPRMANYL